MNNLQYHKRLLDAQLERALKSAPVCIVTGARQTGKSTLVESFHGAAGRTYMSLDELDILEQARSAPVVEDTVS